jgi:GBP family porin
MAFSLCRQFFMPKKIMAAATALATFSAVPAFAQTTGVTLYGLVDAGVLAQRLHARGGLRSSSIGMQDGLADDSNFGLKGVEDLGGGWSAGFQLESAFSAVDGTLREHGRMFGNQATVSLGKADLGSLELGRQQNVASDYFGDIDPFRAGFGLAGMNATFGATDTYHLDNMAMLRTSPMQGLDVAVGYSFSRDSAVSGGGTGRSGYATSDNDRSVTAGARYTQGPLTLLATYDQLRPASGANAGQANTVREWIAGATYDFDVVKLAAVYGQTRGGLLSAPALGLLPVGAKAIDGPAFARGAVSDSMMLGVSAPLGGGTLMASWQRQGINDDALTGADAPLQIASLGYAYNFTPRTMLFGFGAYAHNLAFTRGFTGVSAGVGLQHNF